MLSVRSPRVPRALRAVPQQRLDAPPPDPFGERRVPALLERHRLLGCDFRFEADRASLLRIVRSAYAGLPDTPLAADAPACTLRLTLAPGHLPQFGRTEPPPIHALSGAGLLSGAMSGATYVAIDPERRSALLVTNERTLCYRYHVRYELVEFAVYVLAARAAHLVPLHAACVGQEGRGVLIIGASGAGKSTLVLQCLLAGLEALAEDSVLVRPCGLLAHGVANFLHLHRDGLRFLEPAERRRLLRHSALIRRRGGAQKLEIDLRQPRMRLSAGPLGLRAVLFLSASKSSGGSLLRELAPEVVKSRLQHTQRYAATQPGWKVFTEQIAGLPAFELCRGPHPKAAVGIVRQILEGRRG